MVVELKSCIRAGELRDTKPSFLLGHFSSIVTALVPSGNKRWLASTDREGKARISILPSNPEQVHLLPLVTLQLVLTHNQGIAFNAESFLYMI